MKVRNLAEETKTHKQVKISGPRSKFLDELVISSGVRGVGSLDKMVVSDGVLPDVTVTLP